MSNVVGEGNGNPLQCSCLENLRDGEAWWAAVYGVAQGQTTEATQQQQQHAVAFRSDPAAISLNNKALLTWPHPLTHSTWQLSCRITESSVLSWTTLVQA